MSRVRHCWPFVLPMAAVKDQAELYYQKSTLAICQHRTGSLELVKSDYMFTFVSSHQADN